MSRVEREMRECGRDVVLNSKDYINILQRGFGGAVNTRLPQHCHGRFSGLSSSMTFVS